MKEDDVGFTLKIPAGQDVELYTLAIRAAEMSIWADRRLLGLPKLRWTIARTAALRALGAKGNIARLSASQVDDNTVVVIEAFDKAVSCARDAIDGFDLGSSAAVSVMAAGPPQFDPYAKA